MEKSWKPLVDLVLKAVTVAMGIAVFVLSILDAIEPNTGLKLLGLGLACAGVSLLKKDRQ